VEFLRFYGGDACLFDGNAKGGFRTRCPAVDVARSSCVVVSFKVTTMMCEG
jgi:hypothetical protein